MEVPCGRSSRPFAPDSAIFLTNEGQLIVRQRLRWSSIGAAAKGSRVGLPVLRRSRVAWINSCIVKASAATRSAGAVAGRRPVDAGLTGSRRRLLRLGLRRWLRRLSWC